MTVSVEPTGITPADVLAVARHDARVEISEATYAAMARSRAIVDTIEASGRPVPIGYWKGSGLSIMLDLLATLLAVDACLPAPALPNARITPRSRR